VSWKDERVKARGLALMTKTGQMHARQTSKHIVVVTSLLYLLLLLLLMLTRTSCYGNRILPFATITSKTVRTGKQQTFSTI